MSSEDPFGIFGDPEELRRRMAELAEQMLRNAYGLERPPADAQAQRRRMARVRSAQADQLKAVKRELGGTVNDVVPGTYSVFFRPPSGSGLANLWYTASTPRSGATPVTITGGQSITGIDAQLAASS